MRVDRMDSLWLLIFDRVDQEKDLGARGAIVHRGNHRWRETGA